MTSVIWNLALVYLEIVCFGARLVHGLCLMHHRLRNHFGCTRWYSYVKGLKWKLGLEIVLILMQDRCTVCKEHTICSEINLDAPDRTRRQCVIWKLALVRLGTMLVLVQDRCTVCA